MMKKINLQEELLSSSEIADMFGINLSALSNYKKRHRDFPESAYSLPNGKALLYWQDDIVKWASKHFGDLSTIADNMDTKAAQMQAQAERLRKLK